MTGREKIRAVIQRARDAGAQHIADELADALSLIPDAGDVECLLASNPADHEESRRIAWLREKLAR